MKKVKLLGKFALVMLALASFNGCTDLDENLYSEIETSNFLRNEEEVKAAVGAAYTRLYGMGNHGTYHSTQEVNSDEVLIPQRGNDWYDGGQWLNTHRHIQQGGEDCFNNSWNYLYGGVNTCNRLILQVQTAVDAGNLPAATGATYLSELRGLRALFYYFLMDGFGNVPIVDKFDVPADFKPTNSSRVEVFNFIKNELNAILPNLVRETGQQTYGRFTYWAGQALRCKLALNAGVYTGTNDWDGAIAAADEIVNSGKFGLAPNYRDNFVTANQFSPEMIMAVPYDKVFAQGFNLPQMTLHYQSQQTFNLQQQPWNGYCAATDFYNSYEDSDKRKSNNFIAGPQFSSKGERISDDAAEASDPDGKPLTFTPEINELEPNCLRQAGARIGKYEFETGATPNLSNDFPIFRYADIWLARAEAKARKAGDWSVALEDVNAVRSRSAAPLTSIDENSFLAERAREMFYEGTYRQDLIRFGKFHEPRGLRTAASAPHTALWPIPKNQINANPNLKQNPGYPQ